MIHEINDLRSIEQLAKKILDEFLLNGGVVILSGELGSGKTTLVQYLAKHLKIKEKITSPTFVIHKFYKIPNSDRFLHHLDLYRLENINLNHLGISDLLNNPKDIVLIEWGEKIPKALENALKIRFEKISSTKRRIFVETGR